MTMEERCRAVSMCKYTDEVVSNLPYNLTEELWDKTYEGPRKQGEVIYIGRTPRYFNHGTVKTNPKLKKNLSDTGKVEMEHFKKLAKLGEGTFSKVYRARDKRYGTVCALKVCKVDQEDDDIASLLAEALLFTKADCKYIIKCQDIFLEKNKILFKLNLMYSDLYSMMRKFPNFGRNNTPACVTHIARGLQYLHDEMGVLHCDLKPQNILYDEKTQTIKLGDFNSIQIRDLVDTPGCTRWYRSPESVIEEVYTEASDVWSLGCVMYELLTGKVLFYSDNEDDHIRMLIERLGIPVTYKQMYKFGKPRKGFGFKEIPKGDCRDLLKRMLKVDPNLRITIEEILQHPFLH